MSHFLGGLTGWTWNCERDPAELDKELHRLSEDHALLLTSIVQGKACIKIDEDKKHPRILVNIHDDLTEYTCDLDLFGSPKLNRKLRSDLREILGLS